MPSWLDGSWVDAYSVGVGLLFALIKYGVLAWMNKPRQRFIPLWINGLAIFPIMMLTVSPFSTFVLDQLLKASKVTLFIAGIVAFFALIQD